MAGIYIHIPFCKQACHYCDFHFSTLLKNKNDFLNALLKEIELQKDYFSSKLSNKRLPTGNWQLPTDNCQLATVNSVYFGGGTPSLLSETEINSIFDQLSKYFNIANDAEITFEANPDDLTTAYLKSLRNTPVNRLSIGIQSFSDDDLRFMNRVHNSKAAKACVEFALQYGFENLSVDLIYGTPTMSNETWVNNLQTVFAFPVNHLSCYSLTIEPRTALAKMIKQGKAPGVNDQKAVEQFELLMKLSAENGFEQYEISNFCRKEKYALHNSSYWKQEHYLGLGPSAHSYNGTSRQWNMANNSGYIKSLLNNDPDNYRENFVPGTPVGEKEELTTEQKYNEYVMTSLRTKWGTSLQKINDTFGVKFGSHLVKQIKKFDNKDFLLEKENIFYLTGKGKLFADKIASELFISK
ncbi:MAG TPA: radical SAM family heme chaperone HemW [Bacteroidia bacterium]|nr:radical SAM family heme chaperone HemW [Bacteroidia bacterium]